MPTAVSSILQPLLFLLAFGVGFGTLIDGTGRAAQATGGLDYLVWLAPALLCVSAVQTAVFDSTYPVLSGFKWQRHYLAMTATPIGPAQVVAGHLVWMTIKIGGCGAIYVAVIAAFGGVRSAGDRPGAADRDARRRRRSQRSSRPSPRESKTRARRSPCCSGWC